jgi:hypothetical protein
MARVRKTSLAALQREEASLFAKLEAVRKKIREKYFAEAAAAEEKPPEADDFTAPVMIQVLAALGVQFTAAEIFATAKKMKPDCDRHSLLKAMNRLQRTGIIQKIEAGRGGHPARFEKVFKH